MTTEILENHTESPFAGPQRATGAKLKLLVIDDDSAICNTVRSSFSAQQNDCDVRTAEDGRAGLDAFSEWQPDIILLDIGLPEMSGLQVLGRIREVSDVRVVILSAAHEEADVVRGLEMGADDYITKPFGFLELVARIRAQARHIESAMNAQNAARSFSIAGLTIHFATREVEVDGHRLSLTGTEYRLLYYLIQNQGRLMTYRELLQLVWGSEAYETDVVRVYISRLRSKIEPVPEKPRYILTRPGIGYLFSVPTATN